MAGRNIGLALSGGGSKGAFTVGVLKHLRFKLGVRNYRVISGTSTGALIGTLLCTNQFTRLVKVYSSVKTSDLLDPNHALVASIAGPAGVLFASAVLGGRSIFDTTKLFKVIQENVDFQKVKARAGKCLLIYNAVDLQSGKTVRFNNRDHSASVLPKALLASSNQPVLTDPVDIQTGGAKHQYVDGGVREFLPLDAVYQSGVELDHIFAISTSPITATKGKKEYDKITDILVRTIDLLNTEVGRGDLRAAGQYNALLQILENALAQGISRTKVLASVDPAVVRSLRDKRAIPVTFIGPSRHLEMDGLKFDPKEMKRVMKQGVERAKQVLRDFDID